MLPDDRLTRSLSFGAIALDYDRFRPGPPAAIVEWALPARCARAVDIGAGTGALTRELVPLVPDVVAVEPDARMSAVLAARLPGVHVLSGRAEALPLRGASADAVLGSSMWHWVDEARAAHEAARVLRPGGVLALLWSGPDRTEGWLADALGGPGRDLAARVEGDGRRRRHEVHLPADAPFSEPETHSREWSLSLTPEQLIGLAGTYSGTIVLPDDERARLRDRVAEVVRTAPALAGRDLIDVPMRSICRRAVRLA